jgi:hypothetical protein
MEALDELLIPDGKSQNKSLKQQKNTLVRLIAWVELPTNVWIVPD